MNAKTSCEGVDLNVEEKRVQIQVVLSAILIDGWYHHVGVEVRVSQRGQTNEYVELVDSRRTY